MASPAGVRFAIQSSLMLLPVLTVYPLCRWSRKRNQEHHGN